MNLAISLILLLSFSSIAYGDSYIYTNKDLEKYKTPGVNIPADNEKKPEKQLTNKSSVEKKQHESKLKSRKAKKGKYYDYRASSYRSKQTATKTQQQCLNPCSVNEQEVLSGRGLHYPENLPENRRPLKPVL